MVATFLGVRHHSPACARLVRDTIAALRPAHVLVEGPAEMNGRLDELLMPHELPIALYTGYRDDERRHRSWAPFCDYSPEWVALTDGVAAGAEVRFIDLPAWHWALADRSNRYSDAEARYGDAVERLCAAFNVDNVDALWDHMFEIPPDDGLAERLATYFDLIRGESAAGGEDVRREEYMAAWVRAALAKAGDAPVLVITGGFHRPALIRLVEGGDDNAAGDWPDVPALPAGAAGGSYLVPYSFRRLDAFDGYQSGMPSPDFYQQLWASGAERAARWLTESVARRLRERKQPVSTADLIAARTHADGLALLRGHHRPGRTDILDALAAALVSEALDVPLPWATRGTVRAGSHPVLVEMVAALSGSRRGRLAAGTPTPPLVHGVTADLENYGLDGAGAVQLDLTRPGDLDKSRLLHKMRVLGIPGFRRDAGPATGIDPVLREHWTLEPGDERVPALIEAGGYGATAEEATAAALAERVLEAGPEMGTLAAVLFDAALCGADAVADQVAGTIGAAIGNGNEIGPLGDVLAVALALWRHDTLLGMAGSTTLAAVVVAGVRRVLWLAEGIRGASAPAEPARIAAMAATRDAIRHAGTALDLDRTTAVEVTDRLAADPGVPPDLRGAAFGFGWSLAVGDRPTPERAVRSAFAPPTAGDWLAGLFALAREEVLHADGVLDLLDDLLGALADDDFLIALPALRQAFEYFPPRERETIANQLLERRGTGGSGRALLRLGADPVLVASGRVLDERAESVLRVEGLLAVEVAP